MEFVHILGNRCYLSIAFLLDVLRHLPGDVRGVKGNSSFTHQYFPVLNGHAEREGRCAPLHGSSPRFNLARTMRIWSVKFPDHRHPKVVNQVRGKNHES